MNANISDPLNEQPAIRKLRRIAIISTTFAILGTASFILWPSVIAGIPIAVIGAIVSFISGTVWRAARKPAQREKSRFYAHKATGHLYVKMGEAVLDKEDGSRIDLVKYLPWTQDGEVASPTLVRPKDEWIAEFEQLPSREAQTWDAATFALGCLTVITGIGALGAMLCFYMSVRPHVFLGAH